MSKNTETKEPTLNGLAKEYFHGRYDYNSIFSNPTQHRPVQLFMLERLDTIISLMEKFLEENQKN